jgi:hypothetical protein
MNSRHRKTLEAVFSRPTPKSLLWSDVESLFRAIGCRVVEGEGSRVSFRFTLIGEGNAKEFFREDFHRPHPAKEAKTYQVEAAQKFLIKIGQRP